ncbi:hypothetical protein CC117_12075 [Parafrankia colletiae]|uniref:Uncharacterized protein n=1 Tax=Parafrankia colletiae TaxID=573497 RepID=A0A1S1R5R1_9ACTN|nr:hypothetical protein [Parafrankia colletiae]MCK9900741.1 hypothetical protein [Frankia sp. Cpl3]OHV42308.1 hypothetical protein CC117_12075 [Parafrankia colletiae]
MALLHRFPRPDGRPTERPAPSTRAPSTLPPSVARVAARTRLSAELLAAMLEIEGRTRATLDDMERADRLAARLLARRRDRLTAAEPPRQLSA